MRIFRFKHWTLVLALVAFTFAVEPYAWGGVFLGVSTAPTFSLTANPTSVAVVAGNSGTATITSAVSGGFNSAVGFSASGQPSGVTVSFNPSTLSAPGSGTTTMTMAVASTVSPGTYNVTV